jgi:hypothetical protein
VIEDGDKEKEFYYVSACASIKLYFMGVNISIYVENANESCFV